MSNIRPGTRSTLRRDSPRLRLLEMCAEASSAEPALNDVRRRPDQGIRSGAIGVKGR